MFQIFVDSAANLPAVIAKKYNIHVISFVNLISGKEVTCYNPDLSPEEERQKGTEYYNAMREGCAFLTELDKYRKETGDTTKTVIASTASPYKFTRSVMNAIDSKYDSMGDFELVDELSKISNVKVPNAIEEIRTAPVLHDTVCDSDKMCDEVKKILGI